MQRNGMRTLAIAHGVAHGHGCLTTIARLAGVGQCASGMGGRVDLCEAGTLEGLEWP